MDNIFFDLNTFDELIESLKQKYKRLEIINENKKKLLINGQLNIIKLVIVLVDVVIIFIQLI